MRVCKNEENNNFYFDNAPMPTYNGRKIMNFTTWLAIIVPIEAWESKNHQEIHIEQPHMVCLREIKAAFVLSTTLGEFELITNNKLFQGGILK